MPDSRSYQSMFGGVNPYTLGTSVVPGATLDLSKFSFNRDPKAWANMFMPADATTPKGQTPPTVPSFPGGDAVGKPSQTVLDQIYAWKSVQPELSAQRAQEYQMQAELTRKQMSDVFPYMAAASSQATARNLAASKQFLAFKEGSPSNIQNIMASKQNQMASAADSEYRRAMGIAAQQQAAQGGLRFAGQTFQVG
jgi:hypothetical protein